MPDSVLAGGAGVTQAQYRGVRNGWSSDGRLTLAQLPKPWVRNKWEAVDLTTGPRWQRDGSLVRRFPGRKPVELTNHRRTGQRRVDQVLSEGGGSKSRTG